MTNIIVVGSSGHAKVIIDIVQQAGQYQIAGLLDRFRAVGEETLGYQVLGQEEDLPELVARYSIAGAIVAVGDNFNRARVVSRIAEICPDLPFVSAIHPRATIATDVSIGAGSVVMAGAIINPSCTVGRFCILNTRASLDHDSVLGNFASLAPGSIVGGGCRIGEYSAVGIGAVLGHGVRVGEHAVIGAASLLLKPVEAFVVAYGSPARIVRHRQAGDRYL